MDYQKLFEIKKINLRNINSLYFFTDRKKIGDLNQVLKNLPKKTCIIFREYDLPNKEREELALKYFKSAQERNCNFLVGKDFNLALKLKIPFILADDWVQPQNYPKTTPTIWREEFSDKLKPMASFYREAFYNGSPIPMVLLKNMMI